MVPTLKMLATKKVVELSLGVKGQQIELDPILFKSVLTPEFVECCVKTIQNEEWYKNKCLLLLLQLGIPVLKYLWENVPIHPMTSLFRPMSHLFIEQVPETFSQFEMYALDIITTTMKENGSSAAQRINPLLKLKSSVLKYFWKKFRPTLYPLLNVPVRMLKIFGTSESSVVQLQNYISDLNGRVEKRKIIRMKRRVQELVNDLTTNNYSLIVASYYRQSILDDIKRFDVKDAISLEDFKVLNSIPSCSFSSSTPIKFDFWGETNEDGLFTHPICGYVMTKKDLNLLNEEYLSRASSKISQEELKVLSMNPIFDKNLNIRRMLDFDLVFSENEKIYLLCQAYTIVFENIKKEDPVSWRDLWFELEDQGKLDNSIYNEIEERKLINKIKQTKEQISRTEKLNQFIQSVDPAEVKAASEREEAKQKLLKKQREDAKKKAEIEAAKKEAERKKKEKEILSKGKKSSSKK